MPASSGRTESAAAVAPGIESPLAMPFSVSGKNSVAGVQGTVSASTTASPVDSTEAPVPHRTNRSVPMRRPKRPVRKLPIM